MSYDDYDEPESCECEDFSILSDAIKGKVSLGIELSDLEHHLSLHVQKKFSDTLKSFIEREVKKCVEESYGSKYTFKDALMDEISKRLDEKYPCIVDDKIDELAEKIKNTEFQYGRREAPTSINKKAQEKVDEYIEGELVKSVAKSTEYLEQFSRNYFAENLFRAMGMMDKMFPQANTDMISKNIKE